MKGFLKRPMHEQKLIFEQAAARTNLTPYTLEKDYWVTLALAVLFSMPELEGCLTFKGGTSLSKAWGLIDRFSEDIDLTIHRDRFGFTGASSPEKAHSRSQQTQRLEALKRAYRDFVSGPLKERLGSCFAALAGNAAHIGSDIGDPDGQTLLLHYQTHFESSGRSYIEPIVKMEFGSRSDPWPAESRLVRPLAADSLPQAFSQPGCPVHALLPTRTFWEKAMLLHEESFRPPEKARRSRMARHYYDIYQLINKGVASQAVADARLFDEVASHRQAFFRQNWVDYSTLKFGSLRLLPQKEQVNAWQADYLAMRDMLGGIPPAFEEIIITVKAFEDGINARV